MVSNNCYDIAVIGGGISACVFTSTYIKNGFNGKIAIIENGRRLGGRSSTRNSLANKGWQINHGAPNFNIINSNNNYLLKTFIQSLLDENIIQYDHSDLIELSVKSKLHSKINSDFILGVNYISNSSMYDLSQKIISVNNLKDQIDDFFKTLIIDIEFKDSRWILTSQGGTKFESKFLVCSSNLLLHKRSLEILNVNQIPFRKAIPNNMDKGIDSIISILEKQNYIQRLVFMIYTKPSYYYKDNYKRVNRYFFLNNLLEEKYKFERIIFQMQHNKNLGIVLHSRNSEFINYFFQSKNKTKFEINLLQNFNALFNKNPLINKLIDYQDISVMKWRASQPSGLGVPEQYQICQNFNIGFCGDWIALDGFGRIEGAILSGLKLADKLRYFI